MSELHHAPCVLLVAIVSDCVSLSLEDSVMMASLSSEDELMGLQWVDDAVVNKLFEA